MTSEHVPVVAHGRAVLACPHQLLAAGIRHTLESAGWGLGGVAMTAADTRRQVLEQRPDLCIVLVPFPEGAAALVETLTSIRPRVRVVCLSAEEDLADSATARRVFAAGADGWLTLDLPPQVLGRTLDAVLAGEAALSRRHVRQLLDELVSGQAPRYARADGSPVELTGRQADVAAGLAEGQSTRRMAAALGISEATVRWHVAELARRFGVSTRLELSSLLTPA